MKLHVFPPSPRARKAMVVAHHLGLPFEMITVDARAGAHKTPEFLKLNPNGRVPVLEEDDFVLWESNAIIQHLADKKPGVLAPTDPQGRMLMNQWLCWDLAHWDSAWVILVVEHIVKGFFGMGEPDPAKIKEGNDRLAIVAKVLDGHLADKTFMLGDKLSIVDFALASPLYYAEPCQVSLEPYPHLARWYSQVAALDAWKMLPPLPMQAAA